MLPITPEDSYHIQKEMVKISKSTMMRKEYERDLGRKTTDKEWKKFQKKLEERIWQGDNYYEK